MKKILFLVLASLSALSAACGDDTNASPADAGSKDVVTADTSPSQDSGAIPPRPMLGTQIDRIGRPAINTTANNTFNADMMSQGSAKDDYNADDNVGGWPMGYEGEVANNLAIYDALDVYPDAAGGCGNQVLCGVSNFNSPTSPGAYDGLASLLADDRIYTRTDATTCSAYLAVEANAANLIKNKDCGGRALSYDVIDVTYAAFAMGVLQVGDGGVPEGGLPEGGLGDAGPVVTDGVTADPVKTGGKVFPYLAPPM